MERVPCSENRGTLPTKAGISVPRSSPVHAQIEINDGPDWAIGLPTGSIRHGFTPISPSFAAKSRRSVHGISLWLIHDPIASCAGRVSHLTWAFLAHVSNPRCVCGVMDLCEWLGMAPNAAGDLLDGGRRAR